MLTIHPQPCWYLAYPDGREWAAWGDGTPHYATSEKAASRVGSAAGGVPDDLTPRQFDQPCVTMSCDGDGCDAQPDDGVWKTQHFTDEAEARSLADVYDFVVDADGTVRCPDCEARRIVRAGVGADEAVADVRARLGTCDHIEGSPPSRHADRRSAR